MGKYIHADEIQEIMGRSPLRYRVYKIEEGRNHLIQEFNGIDSRLSKLKIYNDDNLQHEIVWKKEIKDQEVITSCLKITGTESELLETANESFTNGKLITKKVSLGERSLMYQYNNEEKIIQCTCNYKLIGQQEVMIDDYHYDSYGRLISIKTKDSFYGKTYFKQQCEYLTDRIVETHRYLDYRDQEKFTKRIKYIHDGKISSIESIGVSGSVEKVGTYKYFLNHFTINETNVQMDSSESFYVEYEI